MNDNYQDHWRRYKQLRNLTWVLLIGLLPSLVMMLASIATGFETSLPGFVLAVTWFSLFMFVGNRVARWRCPRCGKVFAGAYPRGFVKKCEYCGLPKYATTDPAL